MELFDFDYHNWSTKYPEGFRMALGNSYTFATEPTAPDQRILVLYFDQGMVRYCDPETGAPDFTKEPRLNFNRLEMFYQRHRMWKNFEYVHPVYGMMIVSFNKALDTPKGKPGGTTESFTIELLEHP